MRPRHLLILTLTATLAATALTAQDIENCTRPEQVLSSGRVSTSSVGGFGSWRTAAPHQSLPGDPARGLAPTAEVVYAIHPDWSVSQLDVWAFRRSTDGGFSWEPALEIWTADFNLGEVIDTSSVVLEAEGHNVFVLFHTNRDANGNAAARGRIHTWLLGSNDQGQTWQAVNASPGIDAPLSTAAQLKEAGEGRLAVAGGIAHVVYTSDYSAVGTGAPSTQEDVYYQAFGFNAQGSLVPMFSEERSIESVALGTVDSDQPEIAADGNVVLVTFKRDDSGADDTWSVVSTDAGATWSAEHNHTNFTGEPSLNRRSRPAVDGSNCYVILENSSLNGGVDGDDVQFDRSTDRGQSWSGSVLISRSPAGIDSDGTRIAAGNGKIFVFYEDDRDSNGGNGDNDIYCVVDLSGGADFLAGTHPEYKIIDTDQNIVLYGIDAVFEDDAGAGNGDHVAVSCETSAFPEDNSFVVTSDDGVTWQRFDPLDNVTRRSSNDTDDVDLSITVNRDVNVIYQHDGGRGNSFNNIYVAGARTPHLIETAVGFATTPPNPAEVFEIAILLPSLLPPTSQGLVPPANAAGIVFDFAPDALTLGALGSLTPFITNVGQNGVAQWPLPINFARVIGQPIYWMSFRLDPAGQVFNRAWTDTIVQR